MSFIGNIEPFDQSKNSFTTYVERFEQIVKVNDVPEEKKLPLLITLIGGETYELLKNLCVPSDPLKQKYDVCITLLKNHYNPEPLVVLERFKFNKRDQRSNETIAEYIVQLRQHARTCKFEGFLDEALRDRFICGISNESTQKKLLAEESLTFEKVSKIALGMEMASSETKLLHGTRLKTDETIGEVRQYPRQEPTLQRPRYFGRGNERACYRCGRSHDPINCPAIKWKCYSCHRMGHTSLMCKRQKRNLNYIESEEDVKSNSEEDLLSISMVSESYGPSSSQSQSVASVESKEVNNNNPCYLEININNKPVKFEVDTGAATSVMSKLEFDEKFGGAQLLCANNKKYRGVNGHVLPVVGKIEVSARHKGRSAVIEIIVIERKDKFVPLLGRSALCVLFSNWKAMFDSGLEHRTGTVNAVSDLVDSFKREFPRTFSSMPSTIIGHKAGVTIKANCSPIFCSAYTVPYALKEKVERELEKMEKDGTIFRVQSSDWASPLVIVPKKNGEIRLCVDFRVSLNKVVENDQYPIPTKDDIFASMSGNSVFTVLDMSGAYQQLELFEESKVFFTVNTHIGLMRFNKLTYGLKTAPGIFQKTMDQILKGIPNTKCYIDDVIISAQNLATLIALVRQVLKRLDDAGVRINVSKCKFVVAKVEFLGFLVSAEGIRPAPGKVEAIRDAPTPTNVSELKSYIGLINFYREFVPMQSSKLSPLYELTKKGCAFKWSRECQLAFQTSKSALSEKSLLTFYDPTKSIVLACDASCKGVGAVLSHFEGTNREIPIAFASMTLTAAEKNYSQVEKEALAIIFGVRRFHKYLFGRQFILFTDNQPLRAIFEPSKRIPVSASSRLQRWAIILSAYDYIIRFRKSGDMSNCDALSRLPLPTPVSHDMSASLVSALSEDCVVPYNYKDVATATKKDVVLLKVSQLVTIGWPSQINDPALQPYFCRRIGITIEQECLVWGIRVIIPRSLQAYVLSKLHNNHPGIVKIKMLARSLCWWPNIDSDLESTVKSCVVCNKMQAANPSEKCYEGWPQNGIPWTRLHADFFYIYGRTILLVVDATSKWIDLCLMKNTSAQDVIKFLERLFAIFGLPETVVTDNGPPFTSTEFIRFLPHLGIEAKKSPPYYPRANGLAETEVRVVKHALKKDLQGEGRLVSNDELERAIEKFLFYYRSAPNTATSRSPSDFLLKYCPRTLLTQLRPNFGQSPTGKNQITLSNPLYFPEKLFNCGDKVLLRTNDQWAPASILQILSKSRYLVRCIGRVRVAHRQQLRLSGIDVEEVGRYARESIVLPSQDEVAPPRQNTEGNKEEAAPITPAEEDQTLLDGRPKRHQKITKPFHYAELGKPTY